MVGATTTNGAGQIMEGYQTYTVDSLLLADRRQSLIDERSAQPPPIPPCVAQSCQHQTRCRDQRVECDAFRSYVSSGRYHVNTVGKHMQPVAVAQD